MSDSATEATAPEWHPADRDAAVRAHHVRERCRACDSSRLYRFLELGPTPLANAFLASPADAVDEASYPLDVWFCEECSLVQLLDVIDPELLFANYIYVTGTSDTIAAHNRAYARTVVELLGLGAEDLVVEVASNDGSLLACFQQHGVRVLGVEPARNIAAFARQRGVPTETRFFGAGEGGALRSAHGAARVVIGNNVLAHVDDTRGFLSGARDLLADDGLAIFEVPYARDMIERVEYDTIYHEHLCYFTATSLQRLGHAAGLELVQADHVPVHGGSLRVYFARAGTNAGARGAPDSLGRLLREEREAGLTSPAAYDRFAEGAAANRRALRELLTRLRSDGRTVAAYGAPAKGNTLLNFCGIGTALVPYTVDKSPLKVGRYTPGAHLPVLEAGTLLERQPDYVLILAWNFADEIMSQQQAYHDRGGRFIVPLPMPRIV